MAGSAPLAPVVITPATVVETPFIVIKEFFGRVASKDTAVSACVATVASAAEEAYQTPGFDEYVLVLSGAVELVHAGGVTRVAAGEGAFLPRGLRVKWRWPEPCSYVPICLPAFAPSNCGREDPAETEEQQQPQKVLAKSDAAMDALRQLHARAAHPFLYHVALVDRFAEAKGSNATYYPPTFDEDGRFTHATADPAKLIDVLNHFYKAQPGTWVCLKMTLASLEAHGVRTVFEPTAPVGDTPAIDMGDELFPHILGGIPPLAVLDELPVSRADDGTFVGIPGLLTTEAETSLVSRARAACVAAGAAVAQRARDANPATVFAAGVGVGVALVRIAASRGAQK